MNFLNPLALLGLLAAGIPLLLHLLNLRRLRTIEFSTLRFLQQLQQTQVRRLRLQQILLLILRTLIIVFAVLAFARPTIPTQLPLLSSASRASVVILIDNSASMEAADQRGMRLRQAQDAALRVVDMLNDGDEVAVLPLAGRDPFSSIGFTRTFASARESIERIALASERADVPGSLQTVNDLLAEAAHAHREVFVISDAQTTTLVRSTSDTATIVQSDVSIFLLRIGDGLTGLEQNLSVDSVHLHTLLPQTDKPLEVEAFVRNGSDRDATGVLVSMAFDGVRTAQRAIDLPAATTRSVLLSAPVQRRGIISVSVELEDDAIDGDNVRHLAVTLPPAARVAVVGSGIGATLVATALSLPPAQASVGSIRRVPTAAAVAPLLSSLDVVVLADGPITDTDVTMLMQFMQRGGGLVVFASDEPTLPRLIQGAGLLAQAIKQAENDELWSIRTIDERHPMLAGVFKNERERKVVESPRIKRLLPVTGGVEIASCDVGAFMSEGSAGQGRMIFVGVGMDGSWGPFGGTGLFPATMVRAALYLSTSKQSQMSVPVNELITVQLPTRYSAEPTFVITDVDGIRTTLPPVRLPSSTSLSIPGQNKPGVVGIQTADSVPVMGVTILAPTDESSLTYFSTEDWKRRIQQLTVAPQRVMVADGRTIMAAVREARTGSELWPLLIIIALCCAVAESVVARYGARENQQMPA